MEILELDLCFWLNNKELTFEQKGILPVKLSANRSLRGARTSTFSGQNLDSQSWTKGLHCSHYSCVVAVS